MGEREPTGGLYSSGQSVVLTATASNHFTFTGWSGSLGGSVNPVTITMDDHKNITATFAELLAVNSTPHWWLAQYGLPTSDAGALSDTDGDGLAAWQEYDVGSNPTSAPRIVTVVVTNRTAVRITADNDLSAANAASLARYALNSNLSVYAASLSDDLRTVTLTTTYLPAGHVFTLSVTGLVATNGAAFASTNIAFQCSPDLGSQPVNLIGDPGFDQPRSFTTLSDAYWRAININAGSSNGVELAGRQAWEVARFSATYATYGAGDADSAADTVRLSLDTFRVGGAGDGGTLLCQIRGVDGAAPTSDTEGTALGTFPGNSRLSEVYTFTISTDNDGAWHDETQQVFSVGADYDWYIIRLNVFPNNNGTGEPEFTATAMGVDDVVFTVDGRVAQDTTPPHPIDQLTVSPTPSTVTLSWRQATEDDTEGVLVLRRAGAPPTATPSHGTVYTAGQTLGDATVVFQAPGTNRTPYGYSSLVDSGITAGVTYFYAVYACDERPNYSTAATIESGPTVTFWWDANGETSGLGGSGNWDTSSPRWRAALSTDPLTTWPNGTPNTDEAIFDGTAGTVTNSAGTLNVNKLTFRANGFVVTNGTLALSGADPARISALSGVTGSVGSIFSGTNSLAIAGPGTTILSANNTFSGGTVVSGGTLLVQGQLASPVTVAGGTLGGQGSVAGLVEVESGFVSPGITVGSLSAGSLSLATGLLRIDLTNASGAAGSAWDQVIVGGGSGSVDLTGATTGSLTVDVVSASSSLPGFDATAAGSWRIVDAGSVSGFASSLFVVRTSSFATGLREGTFSVTQSGGDIFLAFTPSTPVDLGVTVMAASNPSDVGVALTYTIIITNAGPVTVGTYYVTNTLGGNVGFTSCSDGGVAAGSLVTWTLNNLAAHAARTLTVATVNPLVQSIVTNDVSVYPLRVDPSTANNQASAVVNVQCPGAPTPFLHPVSAQTIETLHSLSFYVVASNADCSPPAVLRAGGLPSGATFTETTNDYTVTGLFSWPFAGAPGTYPVRFLTANVTGQTNSFSVLIYVGGSGEATNSAGVPVSQTNWHVAITSLTGVSSSTATLTWNTVEGVAYDVYSSDGNLGESSVTWSKLVDRVEAGGVLHTQVVVATGDQRYYQVVPDGQSPSSNGVWAIFRPSIAPGFSTFSPPVAMTDLSFDGDLGDILAASLTGHNVQGMGDEAYLLNTDGSYSNLYLDGSGTWRAAIPGTPVATHTLLPGEGVILLRRQGTAAQPVFSGPVGNQKSSTCEIAPGFNIIGLSEGRHLSLDDAFSSVIGSPAGSYNQTQADMIAILESTGAYTWLQRLPNGSWLDLTTFGTSSRRFRPGIAYWYYRITNASPMEVQF